MESARKTGPDVAKSTPNTRASSLPRFPEQDNENGTVQTSPYDGTLQALQRQQQPKVKRKHRRGKPKPKNANKPYKKTNWKFQMPRPSYNYKGGNISNNRNNNGRSNGAAAKIARSRALVPYNTNKFLMEEHLAEVPSSLLTPSGRTRDSSFSVDSDDNYFYSLPEDEEEFLTKEFDNIYEKARVERLEDLTKEQLIEECLQIEDRYSSDQGVQRQHQLNVQRITAEFMVKIRLLEEKVRELTRENFDLRGQLMRSAALAAAAAASPPSAAAPTGSACQPTPMDSTSEDSESDSSASSSSSVSSAVSLHAADNAAEDDADPPNYQQDHAQFPNQCDAGLQHYDERLNELRSASTSRSSLYEYSILGANTVEVQDSQEDQTLDEAHMEEDGQSVSSNEIPVSSSSYIDAIDYIVDQAVDSNCTNHSLSSKASP